jgi:hypothetical protein
VLTTDSGGNIQGTSVTPTELSYLAGVTSKLQTQLNGKANSSHTHATSDISGLSDAIKEGSKKYVNYSRHTKMGTDVSGSTGWGEIAANGSRTINYTAGDGDKCLFVRVVAYDNGTYKQTNGVWYGINYSVEINNKTVDHFSRKVFVGSETNFNLFLKKGDVVEFYFSADSNSSGKIEISAHPWE